MKKGEVALITIYPEYGYGIVDIQRDLAVVPPNSTLIYEVEMVSFTKVREKRYTVITEYTSECLTFMQLDFATGSKVFYSSSGYIMGSYIFILSTLLKNWSGRIFFKVYDNLLLLNHYSKTQWSNGVMTGKESLGDESTGEN